MKTAVVTGTSYGIGEEIANNLLNNGFKVYGVSRSKPKISSDNFIWLEADLSNTENINEIVKRIEEEKIDLLVNNAGTHIEELAKDLSVKNYNYLFNLNFLSPAILVQKLFNKLNNGLVVNISSTSDRFVGEKSALYSATKAALQMFFDTFTLENPKIKVAHILPSYVDTPLQHKISDGSNFDWGLCTKPKDIADFVLKLFNKTYNFDTGSRIMILNNKTMEDTLNPEKLYYFNVDTKEFKKLNDHT